MFENIQIGDIIITTKDVFSVRNGVYKSPTLALVIEKIKKSGLNPNFFRVICKNVSEDWIVGDNDKVFFKKLC